MFRRLSYIIACSAALGACTDAPEVPTPSLDPAEYIVFGAPTIELESSSRADASIGDFKVLGYCVPYLINALQPDYNAAAVDWNAKKERAHADVFCNQTVGGDGNYTYPGSLEPGGKRRWYNAEESSNYRSFKYSFIAYANGDFTVTPTDAAAIAKPRIEYTIPSSGNPDPLVAATFNRTSTDGEVPLNFHHVLTKVSFKVFNYSPNADLTIKSMTLSGNFFNKTTIDFDNAVLNQTVATSTDNRSYSIGGGVTLNRKPENGNPVGTTLGDPLMLIGNPAPGQAVLGNGILLTVNFTYSGSDDKNGYIENFDLPFVPELDTEYSVNLNFIDDSFAIVFLMYNNGVWEDGGDSNISFK